MRKNCGRSMKWRTPTVNQMSLAMIKKRANIFFMIAQRKALKAAEMFVMTPKRWKQGKNLNWLKTPFEIRELGGDIFADRRYNHVFVYQNGASSYYGGRGFRGSLRI